MAGYFQLKGKKLPLTSNEIKLVGVMNKITPLVFLIFSAVMACAQTKIIAHRGFSGIAPENTLSAFQKAIECGAEYLELDVHQSKDGSIVVIHDASVDRTGSNGKKGAVAEMTDMELAAVKVGYADKFGDQYKSEKIPTLREVLTRTKGKIKVCLEIKVYSVEEAVLKIVREVGVQDEVIIFSFYYPVLAKIRKLDKTIPILYLINSADATTIEYAGVIESKAIGVGPKTTITKEYLDQAHASGIEVWKWTVDDEQEMEKLGGIGVDGLITNFPDKALKIVGQKDSRKE